MIKSHINLELISKFKSKDKIIHRPNLIYNKKENREEIIFLNHKNELIAIDLKGNIVREKKISRKKIQVEDLFDFQITHFNSPKIIVNDFYEDGEDYLFCILNNGELACTDINFNVIFIRTVEHGFKTQPKIVKLEEKEPKSIIIGSADHKIYNLDNKGNEIWHFETKGEITSPIQTYKQLDKTMMLFGSEDNNVYSINPQGILNWKYKTHGVITSKPIIEKFTEDIQETIVVFSHDKHIYLLNFYGQLLNKKETKGFITSNPTMIKDNETNIKYLVAGTSSREQSIIFYNPLEKLKEINFANRVTIQPSVINLMNEKKSYEYLVFSAHNHFIYFIDIEKNINNLENKFIKYNIPGLLIDKPKYYKSIDKKEDYLICTNNKDEIFVKKIII
jgi:hypothetical protein